MLEWIVKKHVVFRKNKESGINVGKRAKFPNFIKCSMFLQVYMLYPGAEDTGLWPKLARWDDASEWTARLNVTFIEEQYEQLDR